MSIYLPPFPPPPNRAEADRNEDRIRAIVREEIASYFASVSKSEAGAPNITVNVTSDSDPEELVRKVEAAMLARHQRGTSYRSYLRDRDEPPAVPPMRVANTTERL